MKKIVHFTTVHIRYDNRILFKMCISAADAGYDVVLLVADGMGNELFKGVKIIDIGKPKNRLLRFVKLMPRITKYALTLRADLYHFHDPELILSGLVLRIFGKRVVYDIHEDNYTFIRQKEYLSKIPARILAFLFDKFERFSGRFFELIIAEKYYQARFPAALQVLNYPLYENPKVNTPPAANQGIELIYTGNVSWERGSDAHAKLVAALPSVRVTSIGRCPAETAQRMRALSNNSDRLTIIGENTFINSTEINEMYAQKFWTAGLALFPKTDHYALKELTKFFEYMKYGIPIICTNFPAWQAFVKKYECGFAVEPDDYSAIENILKQLHDDPALRIRIGENGRKYYKTELNWNGQEQKLIQLYKKMLYE